jgi:hypothetical protein
MRRCACLALGLLLLARIAASQTTSKAGDTTAAAADEPVANPGRPTVSTPATITPVGYFQFETGVMGAWQSPEFSSQFNLNEVIKFSITHRIELIAASVPYVRAHAAGQTINGTGGYGLGAQVVLHSGEGANPTIALGYLGVPYGGDTPDLDIGSFKNGVLVLISNDMKGFHLDSNFLFDEVEQAGVRRVEYGQTLSVSHLLGKGFLFAGEIWHFTQPFLRSNCVGNLWAISYTAKKNLVFDAGFNHGFTSTSTQWEVFAGFTYLLPKKVKLR